ncbi:YbdK family carboxylate-amine ligase [Agromyces sp. SYSU K20354]|uniref:carboxylate-amine ligase n=1 Tax=Agromyces cavernae TaxID=2898659 RepID=UPI001E60F409|nr:YbdK family carboxylate-amine ligase [Agromyces cavernae]MCD2442664.1 YbdK family carboxylate-amine ligase [Agromyces cavernae]
MSGDDHVGEGWLRMSRFGIEEEFMVLDRHRLAPVGLGEQMLRTLRHGAHGERVTGEFLAAQVEYATSIHRQLRRAGAELHGFRRELASVAHDLDVVAVGSGTPFDACDSSAMVTDKERYRRIARDFGDLVIDHQVNGLHVHVEVEDREAGVRALNGVRLWLPCLLALTGNAPFWRGHDTGFASWRTMIMRRLPTMGCPPQFADADDYAARSRALVATGAATDLQSLAWAARLSERFPTIEVRVFDAQLTATDSLLAAALTRSIVTTVLETPPLAHLPQEILDGSLWLAARNGMAADLADPFTGDPATAWSVAAALVDYIGPALVGHGDLEFVTEALALIRARGTGAQRQVEVFRRDGPIALRRWYADTLTEGAGTTRSAAPASEALRRARIDARPRLERSDEQSTVAG